MMDSAFTSGYTINDLQQLCENREEESARLEFKPCAELQVGTEFHDKAQKKRRKRQREDVLTELSRDVSAFLNSGGGTIVYGIREHDSRAHELDLANAFHPRHPDQNVRPEKVVDWVRTHIQPPPTIYPYRVPLNPDDPGSAWFLVVDVPQGQVAYMAKDKRFHHRVGATAQVMEQYEVADVMNRTRGALLTARVELNARAGSRSGWWDAYLKIAVTSLNLIASEYGAMKLSIVRPLTFSSSVPMVFGQGCQLRQDAGLPLGGEDIPNAQVLIARWGANNGNVVFPGDWYDFYGNPVHLEMPGPDIVPQPTYLFQLELLTSGVGSRAFHYSMQYSLAEGAFRLEAIRDTTRSDVLEAFWNTYHRSSFLWLKGHPAA